MSNAPANLPVKDLGATVMGACQVKLPHCCIADPHGPVKTYRINNDPSQTLCCKPCYEQMILAGQWVNVP